MLIKLVVLIAFSVINANGHNVKSSHGNEESKLEANILSALNDMKTEIFSRLDAMDLKISEAVEKKVPEQVSKSLDDNLDILRVIIRTCEDFVEKKYQQLENKLKEYIEEKYASHKTEAYTTNECQHKPTKEIHENIVAEINRNMNELKKDMTTLIQNKFNKIEEQILNLKVNSNCNSHTTIDKKNNTDLNHGCKKREVRGFGFQPVYRLDDESLTHVTFKNDSNGDLAFFEMHFAIKGPMDGIILFSSVPNPNVGDYYYDVVMGGSSNIMTRIRINTLHQDRYLEGKAVEEAYTPKILSPTEFRYFYVKLNSGVLVVGKEGDKTPIVTHFDDKIKSMKYFSFSSWAQTEVTFLYDC